ARELQHQRVGALGKRELLEELIRSETRLRARDAEETAVVVEVLPYRQRPVERVRLRDDADLPLDLGGLTANIETGDERPPASNLASSFDASRFSASLSVRGAS